MGEFKVLQMDGMSKDRCIERWFGNVESRSLKTTISW